MARQPLARGAGFKTPALKHYVVAASLVLAALTASLPWMRQQAAAASAIAAQEPVAIMSAIYRQTIKEDSSGWLEPQERRKYLSKSLLALWAKSDAKKAPEGELGAIDFDLTADTNGLTLKSFVPKLQKQTADAATVAVELDYQKPYVRQGRAIVTYEFVREDGLWKIDNIHTTKWSVRDLLVQWLKDS